tara:strand:+ start:5526 stop:5984 length:459 start_codon:yes stop_codon:yes gene_type:complete
MKIHRRSIYSFDKRRLNKDIVNTLKLGMLSGLLYLSSIGLQSVKEHYFSNTASFPFPEDISISFEWLAHYTKQAGSFFMKEARKIKDVDPVSLEGVVNYAQLIALPAVGILGLKSIGNTAMIQYKLMRGRYNKRRIFMPLGTKAALDPYLRK